MEAIVRPSLRNMEFGMKLIAALGLAAVLAGAAMPSAPPARADEFTAAQKQELGAFFHDYLVSHPEVLKEAIEALDKHDKEAADAERQKVVTSQAGPLFSSKYQATIGNPNATATLVEFFDYNCGYCKRALPDMMKLLQTDQNLRFVLKEFPVLGEGSVEAAHVAVAARMQDPTGAKYIEFHQKLLGGRGAADKTRALAVAKEVGFDMGRLMKDMDSDEVKTTIAENLKLADTLGIDGTPSYVVGDELVVGAVGYDELQKKIAASRK